MIFKRTNPLIASNFKPKKTLTFSQLPLSISLIYKKKKNSKGYANQSKIVKTLFFESLRGKLYVSNCF